MNPRYWSLGVVLVACPACVKRAGKPTVSGRPCWRCDGTGTVDRSGIDKQHHINVVKMLESQIAAAKTVRRL